jgi:hypothetical protein
MASQRPTQTRVTPLLLTLVLLALVSAAEAKKTGGGSGDSDGAASLQYPQGVVVMVVVGALIAAGLLL